MICRSDCQVVQVIRTTLLRRGTGESKDSPIRIIEQYWDFDGNLLWEKDHCVELMEKVGTPNGG